MSALATSAVIAMLAQPACFPAHDVPGLREHVIATLQTESSYDSLAIGVNGARPTTLRPATKEEAVASAKALLAEGRSVDLGLMQINSTNLQRHGLTVETAFDACASLRAGTNHLADDYRAAWAAAHSRYNTGSFDRGMRNGYVAAINRRLEAPAPGQQTVVASAAPPAPAPVNPFVERQRGRDIVFRSSK